MPTKRIIMEIRIAAVWIWMLSTYVTSCRSNLLYYTEDVHINFLLNINTRTHAHTHTHTYIYIYIYASYPSKLKHSHLRDGKTHHNKRNTDHTAGTGAVQNRKTPLRGSNPDYADVLPIKQ